VALSLVPGLGTQRIRTLLAYLRSPVGVWKATRSQLANVPMIGPKTIDKILTFEGHDIVARQLRAAEEIGARVVTPWDDVFPEALRQIYDPPAFFWMQGEVEPVDTRAVAIVGTRRCTDYGKQQAYRLARDLAKHDVTVVSGLAYGVDGAAHRGALDAGGRTIAVLGSGLKNVYPAKHKPIANAIVQGQGAVLSEYSLGAEADAGHFPERNRIVSGIALGTVVVQSHAEGGSLITAQMALDQNREVFAVPGRVNVSASAGANALIQNGAAKLVTCVQDILDELRLPEGDHLTREAAVEHVTDSLEGDAQALYEVLTDTPIHLDVLCAQTGLPPSDALVALLQLEFDGHIRQLAGKQFRRI
jgi:DNA processing protein